MSRQNLILNLLGIKNMKNYEEFEYSIQMTRWFLQPMGIWPIKGVTYCSTVLRLLSIATSAFLLGILLVPCCLYTFLIEKDLVSRLKMAGPMSFCLMNIFKFSAVLIKNDQITSCIVDIAKDWHMLEGSEQRDCMIEKAKTSRFFTTVCALFMYGGGLPYTTILPLSTGAIVIGNNTYQRLAYPSYFIFFNPNIRPFYDLVLFTHTLSGIVMYTVTCGVCSIAILCIMHISSQCSITSASLRSLNDDDDEAKIKKIVTQHLRSLKFASKLEKLLNGMCLVEMVGCTFNMVMLGYYFIMEFEQSAPVGIITYSFLFTSLTFNIFIFCYVGELLTEQCENIGEVAYMTNWYQMSSKRARNLILIVVSSQKPVVLTAGKMVTLSIGTFCNVIKASVTYLNMLRTLTKSQ